MIAFDPGCNFDSLRARGALEVDIEWKRGKLTSATIRSLLGRPIRLGYGNVVRNVQVNRGEMMTWEPLIREPSNL